MTKTKRLTLKMLILIAIEFMIVIGLVGIGIHIGEAIKGVDFIDFYLIGEIFTIFILSAFITLALSLCTWILRIIGAYWTRKDID